MRTGTLLEAQTAFTIDSLGSAFVERGPCRQVHFWRHTLPSLSTRWGQRLWKGDLEDRYTFGGTNCLHYRLFGVSLWKGDLADRYTFGGTNCLHYRLFGVSVCGKGTLRTGTLLEAQTAFTSDSLGSAFVERGP